MYWSVHNNIRVYICNNQSGYVFGLNYDSFGGGNVLIIFFPITHATANSVSSWMFTLCFVDY